MIDEPTTLQVAQAVEPAIEPDDPEFLASLHADCLGCLTQARMDGRLSEAQYDAIMEMWAEINKQEKTQCPSCGAVAYVSMWEPDLAHCPSCGAYLSRAGGSSPWGFMRQGMLVVREQGGES